MFAGKKASFYFNILLFFSFITLYSAGEPVKGPGGVAAVKSADSFKQTIEGYDFATEDVQSSVINSKIENIDVAATDGPRDRKEPLHVDLGNLTCKFQIKYKPEFFYGKNINLLNSANESDRLIFWRSTIDLNVGLDYGKACYGYDVIDFFATIRNKATWGDPESIAATTRTNLKLIESVDDGHQHFISKQIMWIRELWIKFSLNDTMGLPFNGKHFFQIGAFPFELGRGIALGAAFAVNPGPLGFFSDNSIDQYAFGMKLSGDIVNDKWSYDLYSAILENKSASIRQTAENIYSQRCDLRTKPERGAGHINFILAARSRWYPIQDDNNNVVFEPYLFVNNIPECKVDFSADAKVTLGSFGMAAEFLIGNFEFGFDTARNVGKQTVFGWDRNVIDRSNYNSFLSVVNSQVDFIETGTTTKVKYPFVPGSEAQSLIESTPCSAAQNTLQIEGPDGSDTIVEDPRTGNMGKIFNSQNRFRNSYGNTLKGWMLVFDGAYWFFNHQLRFAAGGGVASGDENPNVDLEDPNNSKPDRDFKGFIGIQEIYTGNRVQSVFILGSAGKVARPLTCPKSRNVFQRFPTLISTFSNLVFTGASLYWTPKNFCRKLEFRPNVLAYWQYRATKAFDRVKKQTSDEFARNYLGFEVNAFSSVELVKDFNFYAVGAVFLPGTHFADIKGTPLTPAQRKVLDRFDPSGVGLDNLPLLGDDPAWTVNFGLELRF